MKNLIILAIFVFSSLFKPAIAKAQGWEAAIPVVIAGAKYLTGNWSKVKWVVGGMGHHWTCVDYQDGTQYYDNPRDYRSPDELLTHWTQDRYVNIHGKVVDFSFYIDGNWYSVTKPREFPSRRAPESSSYKPEESAGSRKY